MPIRVAPQVDRDLKYKKSQLAALEAQRGKEVIALIRKLDQEKEVRVSLRRDLQELLGLTSNEALRERIESIETSVDPTDLTIGGTEYQATAQQAAAFKVKVVAAETDLQGAAKLLSKDAGTSGLRGQRGYSSRGRRQICLYPTLQRRSIRRSAGPVRIGHSQKLK